MSSNMRLNARANEGPGCALKAVWLGVVSTLFVVDRGLLGIRHCPTCHVPPKLVDGGGHEVPADADIQG